MNYGTLRSVIEDAVLEPALCSNVVWFLLNSSEDGPQYESALTLVRTRLSQVSFEHVDLATWTLWFLEAGRALEHHLTTDPNSEVSYWLERGHDYRPEARQFARECTTALCWLLALHKGKLPRRLLDQHFQWDQRTRLGLSITLRCFWKEPPKLRHGFWLRIAQKGGPYSDRITAYALGPRYEDPVTYWPGLPDYLQL